MKVLGIDTSNYTTSLAVVDGAAHRQAREILTVEGNECGLRQSNALFLHVKNLPRLMAELSPGVVDAVAYSSRPRAVEGSYMPCFLAGQSVAGSIAATLGVPLYAFSHQAGHIEAAVRTCGNFDFDTFLAYHLSGGTTELLLVRRDEDEGYLCDIIGKTRDISAGQLIDRIGVRLGIGFPCGTGLESAALTFDGKVARPKICTDGADCNLSGAENMIGRMIDDGVPCAEVARFTLEFVSRTVAATVSAARTSYPSLPVLFVGGVMRNSIIRSEIASCFDSVYFAEAELSRDNAVGTAYLGYKKLMKGI